MTVRKEDTKSGYDQNVRFGIVWLTKFCEVKFTFITNSLLFFLFADSSDIGISPQGRTRVKMEFGTEEGTGNKSQRLDAMLAWIRETKVRTDQPR